MSVTSANAVCANNCILSNYVFSPANLSGLVSWLDPSDGSTVTTSGSYVTAVRDKADGSSWSGGATVTLTSFPNGQTGLNFNYAGLISVTKTSPWIGTTNMTGFLVNTAFVTNVFQYPRFISCAANGTDYSTAGAFDVQTQSDSTPVSFQSFNTGGISISAYLTPNVLWWTTTSSEITLNMNQTYTSSGTNSGDAWNFTSMGVGSWAPTIYEGSNVGNAIYTFGELILYNRALSTSEATQVLSYLYPKFGLSQ